MRRQPHNTLHVTFKSVTLALYSKNDKNGYNERYEVALFNFASPDMPKTTCANYHV
jgi:hypothetical protein